jgi:HSP20 family protein
MNFIHRYPPTRTWVSEINRFIDRNVANPNFNTYPRELYQESESAWILRLDLPGYDRSDINLKLTDRILELVAETQSENAFGWKVERTWKLGNDVNASAIMARLENGVLELTLPKKPLAVPQPTTIEIQ